ncbi:TetR family transcriptional regulator [Paenibacillus sp. MZ04-78.2]|uniref:TetR family transcriptional regulator n=1 Tax=Paenibacillus sp. MZ04-78.2 TaxID=2962034 RepID=UPI0020B84426|nr:TetR family transcriptional regulator [Paenibacillus sp. MZ04-78.2]MCP3772325.1 TetR family transcriptional regulator [Paenibacillus sp. MZ04-78.2]
MSPRVSEQYKKDKKHELLQAARHVFIREGYTQATMQSILNEAGVSRGALYSYFDNIEHAFIEVLQFDDRQDILFFELAESSPLWPQLTVWVNRQRHSLKTVGQTLLLAKAEFFLSPGYRQNKESFPYIAQRYLQIKEAIESVVVKGTERGEFRPRLSPEAVALYFVSFMDGLMLNTFQLGAEITLVDDQLTVFLFSLKEMLCPIDRI